MNGSPKILPGTGRGTMWNMVEGSLATVVTRRMGTAPSVSLRLPPPRSGEDLA